MKKHFNIKVAGKVQGVFFRASTKEKANEFGLCGFVKNEHDGSVYIEAEGEEEKLQSFIEWCKNGPRLARVDICSITEGPLRDFDKFIIDH